jgi:hypothetical protein
MFLLRFQATGIRLQDMSDGSRWSKRCAVRGEKEVPSRPKVIANVDLMPETCSL